ncbi:MAG: helix-turn-helix domain-containing protein [Acidobacteria bacterium]|nr:helix-turn-helix domain-containing protein [Acidobacteriota bacterium]
MSTIGELLKRSREDKGLSLRDLADSTKISINFLQAIERNDFKKLPRGVYPKLFVRSMAKYLDLDADDMVRLYYEQVSSSDTITVPTIPARPVTAVRPRRNTRLSFIVAIVLIILLFILILIIYPRLSPPPAQESLPVSTRPLASPVPLRTNPDAGGQETSAAPAVSEPAHEESPAAEEDEATDRLTLRLEATELCWVYLAPAAGETRDILLSPGETFSQTVPSPVILTIGNAGGIRVYVDGRPLRPLGRRAQVVELTLTSTNYPEYLLKREKQN